LPEPLPGCLAEKGLDYPGALPGVFLVPIGGHSSVLARFKTKKMAQGLSPEPFFCLGCVLLFLVSFLNNIIIKPTVALMTTIQEGA